MPNYAKIVRQAALLAGKPSKPKGCSKTWATCEHKENFRGQYTETTNFPTTTKTTVLGDVRVPCGDRRTEIETNWPCPLTYGSAECVGEKPEVESTYGKRPEDMVEPGYIDPHTAGIARVVPAKYTRCRDCGELCGIGQWHMCPHPPKDSGPKFKTTDWLPRWFTDEGQAAEAALRAARGRTRKKEPKPDLSTPRPWQEKRKKEGASKPLPWTTIISALAALVSLALACWQAWEKYGEQIWAK